MFVGIFLGIHKYKVLECSDKLGKVAYSENQQEVFLGHSVTQSKNISEEVRRLIDAGWEEAKKILTKRKKDLEVLAEGLLEYETLTGEEIQDLLAGKKPARNMGDDTPPSRGSAVPKTSTSSKPKDQGTPDPSGLEPQPS